MQVALAHSTADDLAAVVDAVGDLDLICISGEQRVEISERSVVPQEPAWPTALRRCQCPDNVACVVDRKGVAADVKVAHSSLLVEEYRLLVIEIRHAGDVAMVVDGVGNAVAFLLERTQILRHALQPQDRVDSRFVRCGGHAGGSRNEILVVDVEGNAVGATAERVERFHLAGIAESTLGPSADLRYADYHIMIVDCVRAAAPAAQGTEINCATPAEEGGMDNGGAVDRVCGGVRPADRVTPIVDRIGEAVLVTVGRNQSPLRCAHTQQTGEGLRLILMPGDDISRAAQSRRNVDCQTLDDAQVHDLVARDFGTITRDRSG
jgi:hypothetical protein